MSRIRRSRLSRTLSLAGTATRGAVRTAVAFVTPGRGREARKEQAMLRTADDVARTMGNMKGVAMKLGQIVSLMGGAVPEGFAERLSGLQSEAPPMSEELVRSVFIQDFGQPPEKLFRRFDARPFAAASIGQVHRAELQDRTPVAVKVQYPGVGKAIEANLANLGAIFGLLAVGAKGFDPRPMVEDLRNGIAAELDYTLEAANQARFGALYEGHPFIKIPRVYPELGSEHVLVQEFIEGKPFSHARSLPQDQRNHLAEIIFRFTFGSIHRHGLFQADPHAGNYLLMPDNRIAFLDFGCIAEFEPGLRGKINTVVKGVLTGDLNLWRDAMESIGYLPPELALSTDALWEQMRVYYSFILEDGVTFTPELAAAMVKQNLAITGETGRINRQLTIPSGVVFIQRITFGFSGLMAGILAQGPWRSITAEYVLDTEPATELGRQSQRQSPPDAWV